MRRCSCTDSKQAHAESDSKRVYTRLKKSVYFSEPDRVLSVSHTPVPTPARSFASPRGASAASSPHRRLSNLWNGRVAAGGAGGERGRAVAAFIALPSNLVHELIHLARTPDHGPKGWISNSGTTRFDTYMRFPIGAVSFALLETFK